ncbi:octopine/nopaline transport system permease protein [Labrenzia sp. EL_208]|nr:octopine/nopaline transport system permease protein [Labrenzia sp. EL_132]MBG6228694.1 octopine/nopaline transport system permease protein [Labrenzia sp. EL_208]
MLELLSFGKSGWGDELLSGLATTMALAVLAFGVGLVCGLLLMLFRRRGTMARYITVSYVTVFRGVPELLVLYLFFFGTGTVIQSVASSLGYTPRINLSGFALGVFALAVIATAYAAEAFRGAASSIPKGQLEAADAYGFGPVKRFTLIEFPQLLRVALPAMGNIWLVMLKDTALVSMTAVAELMRQASVAAGATHRPFTFYAVAALIYLCVSFLSERLFKRAEARFALKEASA